METYQIFKAQNESAAPVIPLPNPGEGGAVAPEAESGGAPVIPLPNPGEGGAVFPGGGVVVQPLPGTGSVPSVLPSYAAVRFLNATHGYPPFRISIDGTRVIPLLNSASASGYVRVSAGQHTISVSGLDGYIYIERVMTFSPGSTSTVAVINRTGGLELAQIADACRVTF